MYFYARAIQLLRPDGWTAFVTSNSFTKRKYGEKIREYLAGNVSISTVIDFGEVNIFDATVEPYVLVAQKSKPAADATIVGHNLYPPIARQIGKSAGVSQVREELLQLDQYLASESSKFLARRASRPSGWRIEDEDSTSACLIS